MAPPLLWTPRRRFFVKRALQTRLILGVVLAAVVSFCLVLVDYYLSFGRNAGWSVDMLIIFMKTQKLPVIQLVLFVVVLTIVMLKFSHRVAGPLISFENSLAKVGEGDLTIRLQLRPNDELKDVRDAFNSMIKNLSAHVTADRSRAQEITRKLQQTLSTPGLPAAHVAELKHLLDLLRPLTSPFKLSESASPQKMP